MPEQHRADKRLSIDADLVPAHLRPVLAVLLSGATDVTASRILNVSPRTFSRRLAELLEYFEVQTRFQAGVEVGLHGWPLDTTHERMTTTLPAAGVNLDLPRGVPPFRSPGQPRGTGGASR